MKSTRRAMLMAGVGLTQLMLLDQFGLNPLPTKTARAAGNGPTKFLTLYVPGGWMPLYLFCPLSASEIQLALPKPMVTAPEPAYFYPGQVSNLDGSGDSDADADVQRIRVPR